MLMFMMCDHGHRQDMNTDTDIEVDTKIVRFGCQISETIERKYSDNRYYIRFRPLQSDNRGPDVRKSPISFVTDFEPIHK
jgi:hypothetical protein